VVFIYGVATFSFMTQIRHGVVRYFLFLRFRDRPLY